MKISFKYKSSLTGLIALLLFIFAIQSRAADAPSRKNEMGISKQVPSLIDISVQGDDAGDEDDNDLQLLYSLDGIACDVARLDTEEQRISKQGTPPTPSIILIGCLRI